jgi:hypothetical protein
MTPQSLPRRLSGSQSMRTLNILLQTPTRKEPIDLGTPASTTQFPANDSLLRGRKIDAGALEFFETAFETELADEHTRRCEECGVLFGG